MYALEKQHFRPVSPINYYRVDDISNKVIREDNTIRYKANRYSVPLGTYAAGKEKVVYVYIKEINTLVIREHPKGPIIAEHRFPMKRKIDTKHSAHKKLIKRH